MTAPHKPPSAEEIGRFWDSQAASLDETSDLSRFGTVTQEEAVVGYRDMLERAHLSRLLQLGPQSRVLDLGGGAGRIALWLAPKVAKVTLVDVSQGLLQVAERKAREAGIHNVETVHASVLDVRREGPFDAVLIMGVAAHLGDGEVDALARLVARVLAKDGKLYLKEAVSTDGRARKDERHENGTSYLTRFRPREFYAEVFGRHLSLEYQAPTCAHFFPWFLGGTEGAVAVVGRGAGSKLLARVSPYLVPLDPRLQKLEDSFRASPVLSKLLAEVPVLQDFYVFSPRPSARASAEPELSVVVIAYNEDECIDACVAELRRALDAERIDHELVLVDDGSRDTTLEHMRRLAASDARTQVVPLSPNRGIGGALRAGFDAARGRYLSWVPADGQISPEAVLTLFRQRKRAPMLTTVYRTRADAWYRHLISSTLNRLIELRTGQKAKSGGNYLFERRQWQEHAPRADDTMMISTAFRHNLHEAQVSIAEVEIDARPRLAGRSKVLNPKTIARTLGGLFDLHR